MAVSLVDAQQIPAFQEFSDAQVELLAGLLVRRHHAPGELIFLEGDTTKGLWFVLEGRVRIIKMSEGGRVQALCVMNPGKCFGGCPLFSMEKNPANAQALDEVVLLVLPEAETSYLQAKNPELMTMLLQIYSERLGLLAQLSEQLGTWSVHARINDTLVTYAEQQSGKLVVSFTHEKLAHLAGTVREVVTRHLTQLEAQQVIRQEVGVIEILDQHELQSVCLVASR
jgi:CRP-like cAMP-binding protein